MSPSQSRPGLKDPRAGVRRLLAVAQVAALAACGGGPDTTPGPTPTPTSPGRFVYVASVASAEVWAYAIDVQSGGLTPVNTTRFPPGESPSVMAADPQGRFLWVAMTGSIAGVRGFTIDRASGVLREMAGSPFDSGHETDALNPDPSGRFLVATHAFNLAITSFAIGTTNGALTPVGTVFLAGFPRATTMHPSSRLFYLSATAPDAVDAYSVDATGHLVSPRLQAHAPDVVRALAVDPSGAHLYVTTATPFSVDTLFLYGIDAASGSLTRVPGPAFTAGVDLVTMNLRPDAVTFLPSGRFAYVSDRPGRTGARSLGFWAFPVQSSGLLGPTGTGPFATAGRDPAAFAVEPSGRFAYATDRTSNTIAAFAIDLSTGALSPAGTAQVTGSSPISIAIVP